MELDLGPREARVPILLIRIGGYDLDQELSRPGMFSLLGAGGMS